MSNHLTPFDVVQRLIGPPERVGPVVGMSEKTGYGWRRASANRDAGDIPSARTMRALLDHARTHSIPLTAEHLIYGADADEVEAMLAALRQDEDAA